MGTSDLAPDNPDLGVLLLLVGPVDESDPLAHVEAGVVLVLHTLNADESGVGVLGPVAPVNRKRIASVFGRAGKFKEIGVKEKVKYLWKPTKVPLV